MRTVLSLIAFLGFNSSAFAYTQIAADQLTCSQAITNVEKEGRYYLQTAFDGIIPIYVTTPVSKNPVCGSKQRVSYEIIVTTDNEECHVGYICVPS